jgi:predicted porin
MMMFRNGAVPVIVAVMAVSSVYAQEKQAAVEKKPAIKTQIYGQLHGSVDQLDDGEESRTFLSSNSSRVGFKGDVDVEPSIGLKAIWQAEAGLSLDEKESSHYFTSRNTFIGLDSNAGRILFGRHDTPFKDLGRKADMFGDQIGDSRNVIMPGGYKWDLRPDNSIRYTTPKCPYGFSATVQYCTPDELDNSDIVSGNVLWSKTLESKDEVLVGVAYEKHGKWLTGADTNRDSKVDVASETEESGVRVVASYKIAAIGLKASALYQKLYDVNGVDGSDSDIYGGGLSYTIKKETLKAQYYTRDDSGDNAGGSMVSVGVDHAFNENVLVYVAYSAISNESKSKYTMSGDGHGDIVTPAVGNDPSGVSLGMIYKF